MTINNRLWWPIAILAILILDNVLLLALASQPVRRSLSNTSTIKYGDRIGKFAESTTTATTELNTSNNNGTKETMFNDESTTISTEIFDLNNEEVDDDLIKENDWEDSATNDVNVDYLDNNNNNNSNIQSESMNDNKNDTAIILSDEDKNQFDNKSIDHSFIIVKKPNNDNNTGNNDQSTSESMHSNEYVVAVDLNHLHQYRITGYPPANLQQDYIQSNINENNNPNSNPIRQPVLVDNLMALSNDLPPLTAALPMQYLLNDNSEHHQILVNPHHHDHHQSHLPITTTYSLQDVANLNGDTISALNQQLKLQLNSPQHHPETRHYFEKTYNIEPEEYSEIIHNGHHYPHHVQLHKPNEATLTDSYGSYLLHGVPGIPGQPWKDYPMYSSVPKTSFKCNGSYGYYADVEAGCQVWHYCQPDGRHDSFLCSNGTLFNQRTRVCDWWHNVDCKMSLKYYDVNMDLYKTAHHQHYSHQIPY